MNVDISHYLETICNSHGRFRTLSGLKFHRDQRNELAFQAGSHSVIFRVSMADGIFAMKCYTKVSERSKRRPEVIVKYLNRLNFPYRVRSGYLDKEIYVYDDSGQGAYLPVSLSEWVDGTSLRGWLAEKCRTKDRESLAKMAGQFRGMGLWLLEQEWAHGDLKPDNIIVTPKNELRLIDYDSAFVPELDGMSAPELGTPGFQHPLRNEKMYDRHLDDYSIALIATALYALAEFPEGYIDQPDDESLLFDPAKAVAGNCDWLLRIKNHWIDTGRTDLYRLATLLGSLRPEIPLLEQTLRQILEIPNRPRVSNGKTPEIYRENSSYGYRTAAGERLTEAIYDDAEEFSEELAAVRIGKKRYYIGIDGKKRIDASAYDCAESFSEGLAVVRKGKKHGFMDKDGTLAVGLEFGNARPFKEGLAAVERDGKWGYIAPDGTFVVVPQFDSAGDFREGVAMARLKGLFGYIERKGNWLVTPRYSFASGFRNGSATAETEGKTIRLTKVGIRIIEAG